MDPYLAKLIRRTHEESPAAPVLAEGYGASVLQWSLTRPSNRHREETHFEASPRGLSKAKGLAPGTIKYTSRGKTLLLVKAMLTTDQHELLSVDLLLTEREQLAHGVAQGGLR